MTNPRRNQQRKPARRPPFRTPKPTILVVCEGEVTEKEYIEGFRNSVRNPRVDVEVSREHGVPKTVVEVAKKLKKDAQQRAKREKDDNIAYDAVWCVYDRDDHPNLAEAGQMAQDNGSLVVLSNPCIELWLLLHFRESPGMQSRQKVSRMLEEYVPSYDKHVSYETYAPGYPEAVQRAKRLDRLAQDAGESGRNPTTGVYQLTQQIAGDTSAL